jgi:NADH-quinone oxidoreductase subunit M
MSGLFDVHLTSLVIFVPALFALLVLLFPKDENGLIRVTTLVGMLAGLILSAVLYLRYDVKGPEFQLEYRAHWIDELGISYHVGVDGLAASLMLLTGILGPLVVMASWGYITNRTKEFHVALLVLQTAMLGALSSMDLILFYVFWEAMLIPMYLLIGVWGSEERQMAAMKFFLYTLAGSLLMLVAILSLYFIAQPAGARSFDYATIYNSLLSATREVSTCWAHSAAGKCDGMTPLGASLLKYGPWMFAAFALAFAIKVPMFPLHTWLPDAHVQAPVAGSMILAGVMLKMGTFGFWRFAIPLFPVAARQMRPFLAVLAVTGIVYGAMMCLAQRDIKKLIAYSSVSHLGYCMLGMLAMTTEGATGSAYQMLNHGVSTGALFLLFGMLYERRHTRLMSEYGGIAKVMPVFSALFLIITFSSIAVPGTNGFVGEFLVLMGTVQSTLPMVFGVLAATGVILGAAYMLWMVQRVFFGQLTHRENMHLKDVSLRELATALPFVVMVLVMGLLPQPFLERLSASSRTFVARASFAQDSFNQSDDAVRMTVMQLAPATAPGLPAPAPLPRIPPMPTAGLKRPTTILPEDRFLVADPSQLRLRQEPKP